jgi:hypothetical protein
MYNIHLRKFLDEETKMNRQALSTRDDFDYWIFEMDDVLDRFLQRLPTNIQGKLNFSPSSLEVIEAWILENYPTTQAMLGQDQASLVDGAARYVGETFRRTIGGYWDIQLDNSDTAFFGVPILTGFEDKPTPCCPLTLVTTSANRRTGKFLSMVLDNTVKRLKH